MQSDIISEIIEVEESATKIVDSARQESTNLINEAQMRANTALRKALKEKKSQNNQIVEDLRAQNMEKIKSYEEKVKSSFNMDYEAIDIIADKLATKICNFSVFDK